MKHEWKPAMALNLGKKAKKKTLFSLGISVINAEFWQVWKFENLSKLKKTWEKKVTELLSPAEKFIAKSWFQTESTQKQLTHFSSHRR